MYVRMCVQHRIHGESTANPRLATEGASFCESREATCWLAQHHVAVPRQEAARSPQSAADSIWIAKKNRDTWGYAGDIWIWSLKKYDVLEVWMSRVTSAPSTSPLLLKHLETKKKNIFPSNYRGSHFQLLRHIEIPTVHQIHWWFKTSLPQSTTVWAWLKTVVICKQPGHLGTAESSGWMSLLKNFCFTSQSPKEGMTWNILLKCRHWETHMHPLATYPMLAANTCQCHPSISKLLHIHEEASAMSDELIGIGQHNTKFLHMSASKIFVVDFIAVLMSTRLWRMDRTVGAWC